MPSMRAAVVTSFDEPPRALEWPVPTPVAQQQELVEVLAVGLHPRVRTGASGTHYTSTGRLPMVPGIDGVGRLADGRRAYFVVDDESAGSMSEWTVVDSRRTVELPDDADAGLIAAAVNPAMSSWVALRRRVPIEEGQRVLVLGATGSAGSMAVQVAKLLGASRVVGLGRDPVRLAALADVGADAIVQLTDDRDAVAASLATAATDVDIVIDYLWGAPAAEVMRSVLIARADRTRALNWIQIGAMAGPTMELPSVALRSANLRIQGSGQGSVSTEDYLAELSALIGTIGAGALRITPHAVALEDVELAWSRPDLPGHRTVVIP